MSDSKKTTGRKGRIAIALILAAASVLIIGSIDGLFMSPSANEIPSPVASFTQSVSVLDLEEDEPAQQDNESIDAPVIEFLPMGEEECSKPVSVNGTLEINAGIMVSCHCRTCKSDEGSKRLYDLKAASATIQGENGQETTTTILNDPATTTTYPVVCTTTTTTLIDNTTTTTVPFPGTTTTVPVGTSTTTSDTSTTLPGNTTTTTSVTSTTLVEDTTTITSSTTTTSVPSADEFSFGWLAPIIMFFAPVFAYLAAKRD